MKRTEKQEIQRLKNNLYQYFRHTIEGRASVSLLYEKGREIEAQLTDLPSFYDSTDFEKLENAFSLLEQLSDGETRTRISQNRSTLIKYMNSLK